ncbi:unnamed protein product [Coregonus sp. 'balchen']|nr:unnamed protein product [Coregonus sp. 'balchen']
MWVCVWLVALFVKGQPLAGCPCGGVPGPGAPEGGRQRTRAMLTSLKDSSSVSTESMSSASRQG